jgi:hypothetical protein
MHLDGMRQQITSKPTQEREIKYSEMNTRIEHVSSRKRYCEYNTVCVDFMGSEDDVLQLLLLLLYLGGLLYPSSDILKTYGSKTGSFFVLSVTNKVA